AGCDAQDRESLGGAGAEHGAGGLNLLQVSCAAADGCHGVLLSLRSLTPMTILWSAARHLRPITRSDRDQGPVPGPALRPYCAAFSAAGSMCASGPGKTSASWPESSHRTSYGGVPSACRTAMISPTRRASPTW